MIAFDHLAFAGPSLDACDAAFQSQTGLSLPMGGQHQQMGTHNRLCQLGPDTYMELIATDPAQPAPDRTRWFGLDTPPDPPRLQAWLLRSDDLPATLAKAAEADFDLGHPTPLRRDHLRWRFSLRDDGTIPLDRAAPLIIEWGNPGPHPASSMADLGLHLTGLEVQTPHAERLHRLLDAIGLTDRPTITQADRTALIATLRLPDGRKVALQ